MGEVVTGQSGYISALREAGVTRKDQEQVEQAEALIAAVNQRLRRRNSAMQYSVGFSMDPSRERRPQNPSA